MTTTPTQPTGPIPHGKAANKPVASAGDHPENMGTLDGAAIGVGLIGGAASGMAAGLAAGPVGVVAGAVIGAVAGGLAGRGAGLMLDPTTDDEWLRTEFPNRPYVKPGQVYDDYVPFYAFGARLEASHVGRPFHDIEAEAASQYASTDLIESTTWPQARPAVADGFARACDLRKVREGRS